MMRIESGFEIRDVLVCPKCAVRGVVRAILADGNDPGAMALRLVCEGGAVKGSGSGACGVLGVFTPPDLMAWSQGSKADAAVALQRFLDATEIPDNAVDMLAFVQCKNDEIEWLQAEIRQIAEMVHQAYHGGGPHERGPDICDCAWEKCPRGVCRRAQHALGILP